MTFSNDRVVAEAWHFLFPRQLQRQSDIRYEYWKRSVLRNIKNLACETKPTICKLSKSPFWTSKSRWYKGHKLLNVLKNCLWNKEFNCSGTLLNRHPSTADTKDIRINHLYIITHRFYSAEVCYIIMTEMNLYWPQSARPWFEWGWHDPWSARYSRACQQRKQEGCE